MEHRSPNEWENESCHRKKFHYQESNKRDPRNKSEDRSKEQVVPGNTHHPRDPSEHCGCHVISRDHFCENRTSRLGSKSQFVDVQFEHPFEASLDQAAANADGWASDFFLWYNIWLNEFWVPRSESTSTLISFNLLGKHSDVLVLNIHPNDSHVSNNWLVHRRSLIRILCRSCNNVISAGLCWGEPSLVLEHGRARCLDSGKYSSASHCRVQRNLFDVIDPCDLATVEFHHLKVHGVHNKVLRIAWPIHRVWRTVTMLWAVETSLIYLDRIPFFLITISGDCPVFFFPFSLYFMPLVNFNIPLQLDGIHVADSKILVTDWLKSAGSASHMDESKLVMFLWHSWISLNVSFLTSLNDFVNFDIFPLIHPDHWESAPNEKDTSDHLFESSSLRPVSSTNSGRSSSRRSACGRGSAS